MSRAAHSSLRVLIGALIALGVSGGGSTAAGPGAGAGSLSADEVVRRSIAYHDPGGVWGSGTIRLQLVVTYSEELARQRGRATKALELTLAPSHGVFEYASGSGNERVVARIDGDSHRLTVGGRAEISDETRQRMRLRPVEFYRDYYEYLYGMPMKLLDPGARIEPRVVRTTLEGRDALALRVIYDPDVGSDTWRFYFDPATYAMIGYRFTKDEAGTIGETIVLGEPVSDSASGFRIAKSQAWYVLADGAYLATDEIEALTVSVP